jgi:hypothetical protein
MTGIDRGRAAVLTLPRGQGFGVVRGDGEIQNGNSRKAASLAPNFLLVDQRLLVRSSGF